MVQPDLKPQKWHFSEFETFMKWLKSPDSGEPYSNNTISSYARILGLFDRFLKENEIIELDEVNAFIIRSFLREHANGRSHATIMLFRSALSSFFDYMVYEDILNENPVNRLKDKEKHKRRGGRKKKRLPPVLSETELEVLFHSLEQINGARGVKIRAVIGLLLDTGFRVSEMLSLKAGDARKLLYGEPLFIVGKGNRERRVVYLGNYADLLEEYLTATNLEDGAPLLPGRGSTLMSRQGVFRLVKSALKRAGLAKPQSGPHLLRHTAASLMLKRGLTTVEVRDALGHGSIAITEIYLHVV